MWTNFESSVHIPIDGSEATISKEMNDYFVELTELASCMPITSQAEIDRLLDAGYVKEVTDRVDELVQQ